ncbi:MAG: PaaI family thioesterase [Acidimicrobiales bacterium]|jgi:uncharacterized protein (TIGR00369 family)|nr:PaaI family thioesterase [Acidimicrobiales bacterium]
MSDHTPSTTNGPTPVPRTPTTPSEGGLPPGFEAPVAFADTFTAYLGVDLDEVDDDGTVRASMLLRPGHLQPFGITHGGIYASIAEEVASLSTYRAIDSRDVTCVGQSNLTHFLRPSANGDTLRVVATPRHRGRTSWVWTVDMYDGEGRPCAMSTVTMAVRPRR